MSNAAELTVQLRSLGLCSADDSVHPNMLVILAKAYPFIEFGVLFRPDKEGQPRYASRDWVERLAQAVKFKSKGDTIMKLAAHLCSTRVNEFLSGDDTFIRQLQKWGFQRIQINATVVNGVDTYKMEESVPNALRVILKYPDLEFILQKNDETRPLWEGFGQVPPNVSMLVDESKGTGLLCSSWPTPPEDYEIGYAGGIGPENITHVLQKIKEAAAGRSVWIDMESRLRSIKNDKDIFDLDKCYQIIDAVCRAGLHVHPDYLAS